MLGLLPVLLSLHDSRIQESIHTASVHLVRPVLLFASSIRSVFVDGKGKTRQFFKSFQDQGVLDARIAQLESKLIRFEEISRENERLKKLIEFKSSFQQKSIAARVIGWDLSPWRKTMLLDKGFKQGLRKDMTVIVAEGIVGRIFEIGPSTSRVILILDPDSGVGAITDQSRAQGVALGDGSSVLSLRYLEQDSAVSVGETVLTSGIGELFPKGIRIGRIESIGKDSDGLHIVAKVKTSVNFSKIEEVLCFAWFPGKSS